MSYYKIAHICQILNFTSSLHKRNHQSCHQIISYAKSNQSKINHFLQVARHPPPDLPQVRVVLRRVLRQQHLIARRRVLGRLLGRARKLRGAQRHEAEISWR